MTSFHASNIPGICAEYSRNLRTSNPAEVALADRLRIFTGFRRKPVFEYAQIAGPAGQNPTPKPIIFAEFARNMRSAGADGIGLQGVPQ